MNLYLKYNFDKTCRAVLIEQLEKFNFNYTITDSGCVKFDGLLHTNDYYKLQEQLNKYGIEILDNKKVILVQKIKSLITSMLNN
jgi:hypothetical protein